MARAEPLADIATRPPERPEEDEIRMFDSARYARDRRWTPAQHRLVDAVTAVLVRSGWATAGFLVGSLARGTCDRFSDVDYHVVADPDPAHGWLDIVRSVAPDAFVGKFGRAHEAGFPPGAFGLLEDGQKFDLFVHDPDSFDLATLRDHLPTFDTVRSRFPPGEPPAPTPGWREVGAFFPGHAVDSFYFALEAIVQLLCRRESYLAYRNGSIRLDVAWVPLFLAENGIEKFDGKRRIATCLTDDQIAVLDRLIAFPYGDALRLVAELRWEIGEFTRRGRALAERTGAPWPADLERIVTNKFLTHLPEMIDE